jgi:DNA-binding beta-propeller fold protein YncE
MQFAKYVIPLTTAFVIAMSTQTPAVAQDAIAKETKFDVLQHWVVGEPSKWDFAEIDTVRHHLFVTKGDSVIVLDLTTGKLIGEIPAHGSHGVVFAQDLKQGFISNGKSNTVTVFDLDSLKVRQEIKIPGVGPDVILFEPVSKKVYVFNGKSTDITVIDATNLKILLTFAATGRPEFAVSNGAGKIFFNIEDKSKIGVIDVATDKITTTWALKDCEEPSGLAIDTAHQRLFSVCQNKNMVVTDAKSGKLVANVTIGEHPDAVVYDDQRGNVISSNGGAGGTLTVVHQHDADHYSPVENLQTAQGAKTMAMDFVSNTVYLPVVENGQFQVLVLGSK